MKANLSNRVLAIMYLIALLFLGSCSASKHVGVTLVKEPSLREVSEEKWLIYWQDQFDANSGKVNPPSDEFPDVARRAYQKAKIEWDIRVTEARMNTWLVAGCVAAGLPLILVLLTN